MLTMSAPLVPPVLPPAILRSFDPPRWDYGAGHRGLDMAATTGQQVRAMAAGVVRFAGQVAGIPVITVEHHGGLRSTYVPVVADLAPGDAVGAGQVIGTVAPAGGHCGGEAGCVHVGVRDARGYLDPSVLMASYTLKGLRQSPGDGPAGR